MAYTPKQYRRLADGHVFNAVQHTMSSDVQVSNVVNQIGAFILGMDVEASVGILNERMLDIIHPVEREWDPKRGVATIEVIDPNNGLHHRVELNDWIAKHSDDKGDFLLFIKPAAFLTGYAEVEVFETLRELIQSSMKLDTEGTNRELAVKIASAVLKDGWIQRKELA